VTELLKNNRTAAIWITCSVLTLLLVSAIAACDIDDVIRVKVPEGVAKSIEVEESITLAESDVAWDEWLAWVERQSSRFATEIDRGNEIAGVLRSLTETGIQIGQEAAATLPGGALLTSGMALLGGLFLRRPGDAKREQREKEASYNAGLEKGQMIADAVKQAIDGSGA
jgi:hypothetical protein